jgi:nicotinamide-nucleotide amidase
VGNGGHGRAERVQLAGRIAELLGSAGLSAAVAESLTGGMLASALAEAPGSSRWFRGAVVAYARDVKHELLTVPPGRVVSAHAAAAMAEGVRRLLRADVAVALTGAAGPDGQDGQPPGTVFLALSDGLETPVEHHYLDRDNPAEVCAEAVIAALRLLHRHLCPGSATRSGLEAEQLEINSPSVQGQREVPMNGRREPRHDVVPPHVGD